MYGKNLNFTFARGEIISTSYFSRPFNLQFRHVLVFSFTACLLKLQRKKWKDHVLLVLYFILTFVTLLSSALAILIIKHFFYEFHYCLNSLFPYIYRLQIRAALNQQTQVQFSQYASQQCPGNKQQVIIMVYSHVANI